MKATIELRSDIRARDIRQFLSAASKNDDTDVFIYKKDGKLFLTTDSAEALTTKNSRKELLTSLKEGLKRSGYGDEVQTLFKDIRDLAMPFPLLARNKNTLQDKNKYLTLTSTQLTLLLRHRSDPGLLMSHASRGFIIDASIRSLQKSLQKYEGRTPKSVDERQDTWLKEAKDIGAEFAGSLLRNFQKEKPSASPVEMKMFKISFLTNDIYVVKEALKKYCEDELGFNFTDDMLDAVASGLQESISNTQALSIQEFKDANSASVFLPDKLALDGELYEMNTLECAGKGAHGAVYLYRNNSQPQKILAVKSPLNCDTPENILESNEVSRNELTSHLRAQGIGHENVVEVKGAFLADDKLSIALEDCSGGVLDSFVNKKLNSFYQDELLNDEEVGQILVTLGRDVLRGLNFLHTESRIMHMDFKPQNVFIGADGKAKIGDFDRSVSGTSAIRLIDSIPETAQYTQPSLSVKMSEFTQEKSKIIKHFDGLSKNADKTERKKNELAKSAAIKDINSFQLSQSDDVYAAGVTLYELFYGRNPFLDTKKMMSETALTVEKYGEMTAKKRSQFLFENRNMLPGLEQQADEIKKLISGLMHPNPNRRLSISDALDSPIFNHREIGSDEARQLIMKAGSFKNPDATDE